MQSFSQKKNDFIRYISFTIVQICQFQFRKTLVFLLYRYTFIKFIRNGRKNEFLPRMLQLKQVYTYLF